MHLYDGSAMGLLRPTRQHGWAFRCRPGVLDATTGAYRLECLKRHLTGDWGSVCREDRQSNDIAVQDGGRVLSAYPIDPAKPCQGFGDNNRCTKG